MLVACEICESLCLLLAKLSFFHQGTRVPEFKNKIKQNLTVWLLLRPMATHQPFTIRHGVTQDTPANFVSEFWMKLENTHTQTLTHRDTLFFGQDKVVMFLKHLLSYCMHLSIYDLTCLKLILYTLSEIANQHFIRHKHNVNCRDCCYRTL